MFKCQMHSERLAAPRGQGSTQPLSLVNICGMWEEKGDSQTGGWTPCYTGVGTGTFARLCCNPSYTLSSQIQPSSMCLNQPRYESLLLLHCTPLSGKATCLCEFCKPEFPGKLFLLPASSHIYLQLLVPSNTSDVFHFTCTKFLNSGDSGLHLPELRPQ